MTTRTRNSPPQPAAKAGRATATGKAGKASPLARAARPRKAAAKVPEAENWDQRLGFLMHDVSRLRRTVFDDFMKPLGVTRSQWWVLAHLSRHDGMIQSDLANVLELGKAALGGLLDRLEASELIQRRPDEVDRRAKRIYVSARGSQLIAEMRVQSHEMSERMLDGLDRTARQTLVQLLQQVKHNLAAIKVEDGIEEDGEGAP